MVDLLSDLVRPALGRRTSTLEKNVIQEEIAVYEDQPRFRIYEKLMGHYFLGHPLGNSILGTKESMPLRQEQMQEYFDRRYSATT